MRSLVKFLVVPAAVAALAGAWCAASPAVAAAPPSDLAGYYAGKLKSRSTPLSTDRPDGGTDPVGLQVLQEGNGLLAYLTVFTADEGDLQFTLEGMTGGGRFWLAGEGEIGSVVLTGSAKGSDGKRKIKAAGTFFNDEEFSSLKISLKESLLD